MLTLGLEFNLHFKLFHSSSFLHFTFNTKLVHFTSQRHYFKVHLLCSLNFTVILSSLRWNVLFPFACLPCSLACPYKYTQPQKVPKKDLSTWRPFKIRPSKSLNFKCFWVLNGRNSGSRLTKLYYHSFLYKHSFSLKKCHLKTKIVEF